jgi:hypothetical protein
MVFHEDWDLLLDQVWLFFDDRDDLVYGFRYRNRDILNNGNVVWFGNPNWDWNRVRLGYGN